MTTALHSPLMSPTHWHSAHFDVLSGRQLYAIMQLRQEVFVVEQRCPYLDADGFDAHARHLWSADAEGRVVAYARVFGPGVKCPEASIGRVATAASVRRTGLGRALVTRAVGLVAAEFPGAAVHISAQAYLERFYASFGFVTVGDGYLEDDIPHLGMTRQASGS